MITIIYRPGIRLIFLLILLFALKYTDSYAISQAHEPSLILSSSTPEEVIYLAQSSNEEELKKEGDAEESQEEEEEPDCD